MTLRTTFETGFVEQDKLLEEIQTVFSEGDPIPSKYLYLGLHGAYGWSKLDEKYKPGKVERRLIKEKENFKDIYEKVFDSHDKVDIISLGSGNCDDEKLLLDKIVSLKSVPQEIELTLFDLSLELLTIGINNIQTHINKSPNYHKLEKITLNAACLDFEKFNGYLKDKNLKEKLNILTKSPNNKLFLLLGLTLQNYRNEIELLKSFYTIMHNGDFLLLGIDFCAAKHFQKIIETYYSSDILRYLKKFIISPLYFTSKYNMKNLKNEPGKKQIFLNKSPFHKCFLEFKDTISNETEENFSEVDGYNALYSEYTFDDNTEPIIAAHTSKYSVKGFEDFIATKLEDDGLIFGNPTYYKDKDQSIKHYLVLLQCKKIENMNKSLPEIDKGRMIDQLYNSAKSIWNEKKAIQLNNILTSYSDDLLKKLYNDWTNKKTDDKKKMLLKDVIEN